MDPGYLVRQKAIAAVRAARHDIIRIAAEWEASHAVDTAPLNPALFAIQEALSALESLPQVTAAQAVETAGTGNATDRAQPPEYSPTCPPGHAV